MKRLLKSRELNLALRLFVGVLFLYASLDKIQHPHQFAISVRAYQIVPIGFSNLFAMLVSWGEAVAGSLLILGLFTRKAAAAIFILLIMFVAAVSTVLVRGMVIDCGCFKSDSGSTIGPMLIVRNIGLMVATLVVMRFDEGFLGLSRLIPAKR